MSKHHRGGKSVPAKKTTSGSGSKQNIMIRRQEKERSLQAENDENSNMGAENAATQGAVSADMGAENAATQSDVSADMGAENATQGDVSTDMGAENAAKGEADMTDGQPESTEQPEAPEQPETDGQPESTEQPEAPEQPETDGQPETTEQPEATKQPETDGQPESTEQPETTEQPEAGETFDTESGQMAFIEGVKQVEATEEEPLPDEPEGPHPEQIAFVDGEEQAMKRQKKEKVKKEKQPKKEMVKTKKKRGFCFHCCMSLVIFNFVCTFALLCVGWAIGDQYCRERLGLSLTQTFGVYSGITHSSSKMVDNRYTDNDEQGFYDSLGGAMLLKEGAVDGEEFKDTLGDGLMAPDAGIGDVMLDYALGLFTRDNLDQAKLDAIDIDAPVSEDTMLTITDKQLGAFLNGIVAAAVDQYVTSALDTPEVRQYGIDPEKLDVKQYVRLDQIKFFEKDSVDMLRATVSVNFSKALSDAKKAIDIDTLCENVFTDDLESLRGVVKTFSGLAISIVKSILPSRLYLTVDIGLSETVEPSIYINKMDEGDMNNLYSLLKVAGLDLKAEMNKLFVEDDGAVKSVLDDINGTVDLSKIVSPGELKCDLFDLIIGIAGLNYETIDGEKFLKPIDRQINSADILGSLKLLLSDSKDYVDEFKSKEYSYKDYDIVNGKLVKDETGARYDAVTGEELDELIEQYEKEILKAFADGYGLKTKYDHADGYGVQDIIDRFSDGSKTDAIMEMFDSAKLKEILDGKASGVVLSDRMIAALFMNMLPSLLEKSGAGINPDAVEIEFIYLEERKVSSVAHNILNIALSLKFDSLLSGLGVDEKIANLINNLLADKFIITMGVDISLDVPEKDRISTEFTLNGFSAKTIDKVLLALGAFSGKNGEPISLGTFLDENVIGEVRKVIDGLNETLPGLKLAPSQLILPDIFDAITGILNKESDSDIESQDLKTALELIMSDDVLVGNGKYAVYNNNSFNQYIEECEKRVLDELHSGYGLQNTIDEKTYDLSQVLAILGVGDKVKVGVSDDVDYYSLLDTTVLESKAFETEDKKVPLSNKTLIEDPNSYDLFSSVIRSVVFGGGMDIDLSSFGDDFDKENLLYAKLSEEGGTTYLTIAVKMNMTVFMDEMDDKGLGNFITGLLPDNSLAMLKIDVTKGISDSQRKASDVIINDDAEKTNVLFDLMNKLGVNVEKTLDDTCDNIRNAFLEFNDNFDIEYNSVLTSVDLPNVFTIISDIVFDDETVEASDVKAALKGIYTTSNTEVGGKTRGEKFIGEKVEPNSVQANSDYDEFMNDMRSKYYLAGEAAKAKTFDDLYNSVAVNGFDVKNVNIDGTSGEKKNSLAYDTRNLNELKPIIKLGDLGKIMQEKLPEDNEYEVYSLGLSSVDGENKLTLYVKIAFSDLFDSDDNDQLNKLVDVEYLFAEIVATLDKIEGTADKQYYASDITINGMDDMDPLFKVVASLTDRSVEEAKGDLETIEKDVGNAIFQAIDKLETSLGEEVTYKTEGAMKERGIELCDVFSFLGANICKDDKQVPESQNIRSAIQGMYEREESINNTSNYELSEIVRNGLGTEVTAESLIVLTSKAQSEGIDDKDFGAALSLQSKGKDEVGEIKQFSILTANGNGTNSTKERGILKNLGYELGNDKTFVLLTVTVNTREIMGETKNDNLSALVGENMFITFILEYVEGDKDNFTLHDYIINNMSKDARDALTDLIGIEQDDTNGKTVGTQAENSMNLINDLLKVFNANGGKTTFVDHEGIESTVRGTYKVVKGN